MEPGTDYPEALAQEFLRRVLKNRFPRPLLMLGNGSGLDSPQFDDLIRLAEGGALPPSIGAWYQDRAFDGVVLHWPASALTPSTWSKLPGALIQLRAHLSSVRNLSLAVAMGQHVASGTRVRSLASALGTASVYLLPPVLEPADYFGLTFSYYDESTLQMLWRHVGAFLGQEEQGSICYMLPADVLSFRIDVRYEGKAAHAAHSPWKGVNAQDAAVAAYINLALMRQHTNPAARVLGVVKQSGGQANVISESSGLVCHIRAPDDAEKRSLVARAEKGFQAAAKATGCGIDLELGLEYNEVIHNEALVETYRKHSEALGAVFADADPGVTLRTAGSTDVGNVSYVLPAMHPSFDIGTPSMPHTKAFAEDAATDGAHRAALRVAEALALTALDLMSDAGLMERVRSDFATWKTARVPSK